MLAPIGNPESGLREVSSAGTGPAWRIFLPSIADLIFLLLFWALFAGALSGRPLADGDVGWHIRNGERILQTRAIPRVDPFSSSMAGNPWFAWEWLYDVLIGVCHRTLGLNGAVWLCALIISACFALSFWALVRRGTNLLVATVLVLLATSASTIHFFARPHIVSWLLILIYIFVLDQWETRAWSNRVLYVLPLLMLFWVNMHGGFLFGLAILGCFWISTVQNYFRTRNAFERVAELGRVRRASIVLLLTVAATFINPYGYRLHMHIGQYLSNRFLMDQIDEFRSPDFHGVAQKCFLALIVLTMVTLVQGSRKLPTSAFLVLLFAIAAGLYASRNIPIAASLLIFVIGPSLSAGVEAITWFKRKEGRFTRLAKLESTLNFHLCPIALMAATLLLCIGGGRFGAKEIVHAQFDGKRFPVNAVDEISKGGSVDAIFCPDYWSGYLIYRLWPKVKVVVDDRHDFYGEKVFTEYLELVSLQPSWDSVLDRWKVRRVLIPPKTALAVMLQGRRDWKAIYSDSTAVLFERTAESQN